MSADLTIPPKIIFTTGLIDKSGNKYDTVIINGQEWIVQNYRTTKYADGSTIPLIEDNATWAADTTGAMCYYNNAAYHADTYGAMYNPSAINNAKGFIYLERDGVEETGWRLPTYGDPFNPLPDDATQDIPVLQAFCGGAIAGKTLKEVGFDHWRSPNTGTDSTGFRFLPSGRRAPDGSYAYIATRGYLWTTDKFGNVVRGGRAFYSRSDYNFDYFAPDYADGVGSGRAVRLVRDVIL